MAKKITKTLIGWEEWCALPDLNLPAVKAKVDTGAKTSAIHAYDIEPFKKDGQDYVRFKVHPIQKNRSITRVCEAPVVDHRVVTSSNGQKDKRYVIQTTFKLGDVSFTSEITLTSRFGMSFRMLLGKEALKKGKLIVDPAKAFALGKRPEAKELYL
jgi:ribosomal protein S6--L-glutamate ligase